MSLNNVQCHSDQDDEQSRRWSTKTVASTSFENGPIEERIDAPTPPEARQVTAETLSRLPRGNSALHASMNSLADESFHERQVDRAQEGNRLNAKHVAAMTLSVQQCCDIIASDPAEVDAQAEMLLGLQMHMTANPAPGIPADLHRELEPNPQLSFPVVEPDDQDGDFPYNACIQEAYATAYQLRPPGAIRLGSVVAETMRREAAMDDAIFRPNQFHTKKATMLMESRRQGEDLGTVAVRKAVRKRKREEKDPV